MLIQSMDNKSYRQILWKIFGRQWFLVSIDPYLGLKYRRTKKIESKPVQKWLN